MNESEFRRLVRAAVGQPPPPLSGEQLHAFLVRRAERRRQGRIAVAAFGLAVVVVVVLFGGYRLVSFTQRPTTPAQPPPVAPTAQPSAPAVTPVPAPSGTPTPPAATPTPEVPTPRFASFPLPGSANPIPAAATVGPDGAVWYTVDGNPIGVGRVSSGGAVQTYPLPGDQFSEPAFITAGPDGALWFARSGSGGVSGSPGVIGRMSVTGQYTEHALPTRGTEPIGIAAGPDGALWFTEQIGNKIGRITPSGQVREYALPSATGVQCGQLCPGDITVGPDGALWFVNTQLVGVPGIGRITTAGAITLYSLPKGSVPAAITTGPDGNLWFAEYRGPGLGRITPSGQVTEFTVPGLRQSPAEVRALTAGPDGAIWFTIDAGLGDPNAAAPVRKGQLGRITTGGSVMLFNPPGEGTTGAIVQAPDGSMWALGLHTVTRITLG